MSGLAAFSRVYRGETTRPVHQNVRLPPWVGNAHDVAAQHANNQPFIPEIPMRAPSSLVPLLTCSFVALVLIACSADMATHPLTPGASPLEVRGPTSAATQAKRIHGALEATEGGVLRPGTTLLEQHLDGEGIASHLGRFTMVADFTLNLATATAAGSITITSANGDVLTGTTTGSAVVGGGIAAVTETVTLTGGTGRFAGATGTLTMTRRVVQATLVSSGTIDGTITLPK